MIESKTCIIFGGSGFIGKHFCEHVLKFGFVDSVVIADLVSPGESFLSLHPNCRYVKLDVRCKFDTWSLPSSAYLIANFAAIHREPGHLNSEYYETNIPGADNVCNYAISIGCSQIIFTSSIAPYGPTESVKTEESIPTPVSGYGGSKLVAEKIHMAWQAGGDGRSLVIVRPGVVFGPGEGGNVTRLVQATLRRYFLYMGNRSTRKAGGYVKELANTMTWALERVPLEGGRFLYNFTVPQPPTVEEYVNAVCKVAGVRRWVPSVPFSFLLAISYVIELIARPLGIKQPISPVRIRKLVRSNNIEPAVLLRDVYQYEYNLETAMADWRKDRPDEWK